MKNKSIFFSKTILSCLGIAALALLFVNLVSFLISLAKQGWEDGSTMVFKHATFYINGQATGLPWGEPTTNGFLLLMFGAALFRSYQKGKFSLKSP